MIRIGLRLVPQITLLIALRQTATAQPFPRDANAGLFLEINTEVGLADTPQPWPNGTFAISEMTLGGVALFDYDGDGDLDILQTRYPPPGELHVPAPNRLYQQQSDGTFLDVSTKSGLDNSGYGQGVAVGDVDNDGDVDVYLTNLGRDAFYRNNGDETFVDETSMAGFDGERLSTSAAFVDYDRDGDLDLYVVHYVQFDPSVVCKGLNNLVEYCGPQKFDPTLDTLYRNNGDGTFRDVSAEAGITSPGRGLGVVAADFTSDGWPDIYVANDGEVNQLWVNNGDGTFADEALIRGVGFNAYGHPEASMGVTTGDADGDGKLDLFMTHLRNESNTIYMAAEHDIFHDESDAAGLSVIDLPYTGFGCGFVDYDNDGDLDIAVANGRVRRGPVIAGAELGRFWNPYAEPNILLENDGRGAFTDVSSYAKDFTAPIEVSRGLAFGDIDRDGDVDLVVNNLGNRLVVLRNDAPEPGTHWLRVRALTGNRDALGAEVRVVTRDVRLVRLVLSAYSYASASEAVAHFGLGKTDSIERVEVTWPDATQERFLVSEVDREITLRQGSGAPP